ncbi:MAG TPA: aminotransferase class III-fold pyridoxal phosphate-dependent enzyme, partial [Candidatus Sulfotelmatobacter sp.]
DIGERFQRRAREWQRRWSIIGDIRGLGGMQAIELVQSQESKTPAGDETKGITQYCYEHGLITITAGTYSNVIRVLVPLVMTNEQMDEALAVLESAIAAVCDQKGAVAQLV